MPRYREPEAYIRSINYPNTVSPDEAFHVIIKVCNKYYDSGCPAELYCKVVWTDRDEILIDKRELVECYSCLSTVDLYFTAISEDMHLHIEVGHKSFKYPYNWVMDETRDITIVVVECENDETKCIGTTLYKCIDGKWNVIEQNSPNCIGEITVEGYIYDSLFKFPLYNTSVEISGQKTYTDHNGFYHIESLPVDTELHIIASKLGYLNNFKTVYYVEPGVYQVDMRLLPLYPLVLIGYSIGLISVYHYRKKYK